MSQASPRHSIMSRREKEKQEALGKLAKFAYSAPTPPAAPPAPARPATKPAPARPTAPRTPAPAPRAPLATQDAARARTKQAAERKAKLDEERALKQRRANELARGTNLPWRGMDTMGVPASIRRTGFDRDEASTTQKIHDVLGETKEKDGRVKHRAKGKRQGGK